MKVQPASVLGFIFDTDYRKYYLLLAVTIAMLIVARNVVRGTDGAGLPRHP